MEGAAVSDDVVAREVSAELTDPDQPGWRRPEPDRDGRRADLLLAIGLFVGSLLAMVLYRVAGYYDHPAAGWVCALVLAAITLPLALRRRWPTAVAAVVAAATILEGELHVPEIVFSNIALFLALYTVGAWEPDRRRAFWARLGIVVGMFVYLFVALTRAATDPTSTPGVERAGAFSPFVALMLIQILSNVLYFAGAWWFGEYTWNSARERARTAWRGRLLQIERLRSEEQAVALERLRLARELHDSVAHHVSLMGVQAAAARTLLPRDEAGAAASLELLEGAARQAVDELAGVLGVLRAGGSAEATPGEGIAAVGVERLDDLVGQARGAGMAVTFGVVGEPVPLAPMTSLTVYRVAQEALTNTRKHGGATVRADVRLRWLADAVEVEVSDDGVGRRRSAEPSSGLGLVGMRERVAAVAGTLTAGPRERGGFLVRARLPLDVAAPPASSARALERTVP
jgi:signal transduction histidine kinase